MYSKNVEHLSFLPLPPHNNVGRVFSGSASRTGAPHSVRALGNDYAGFRQLPDHGTFYENVESPQAKLLRQLAAWSIGATARTIRSLLSATFWVSIAIAVG